MNTDNCVDTLATCADTAGSFTCTCNAGYQGDGTTAGTGCSDVDECALGTHTCDAYARCDNTVGSFECRGLFAVSPFQNLAWRLDPATWKTLLTIAPTLTGSTVAGTAALAADPTTKTVYAIAKVNGGRALQTVDTMTMTYTQVGDLGDKFTCLAFDPSGQMFATTGNGATTPETLFTIDKATGTKTLARALGNGADGEVIAYNPNDQFMYHWSGNGTVVFEKFPATPPYDPITNIVISGAPGGETFGAHFDPVAGDFIVFNINSQVVRTTTSGAYTSPMGAAALPDDLRTPAYGLTPPQNVVPARGSIAGGYTVQLHSQGFSQLTDVPVVTFDATMATNVTVDSDTQLTVTVPAGAVGQVSVTATGTGGGTNRTFAWPAGFTYTAPFAAAADLDGPDAGIDSTSSADVQEGGCAVGGGSSAGWLAIGCLIPLVRRRRTTK